MKHENSKLHIMKDGACLCWEWSV